MVPNTLASCRWFSVVSWVMNTYWLFACVVWVGVYSYITLQSSRNDASSRRTVLWYINISWDYHAHSVRSDSYFWVALRLSNGTDAIALGWKILYKFGTEVISLRRQSELGGTSYLAGWTSDALLSRLHFSGRHALRVTVCLPWHVTLKLCFLAAQKFPPYAMREYVMTDSSVQCSWHSQ